MKKGAEDIQETLNDRGQKYGPYDVNAMTTQAMMDIAMSGNNADQLENHHKETLHMIFHKISRCVNGDVMLPDNFRDIGGYAGLELEILISKQESEYKAKKQK